MKKLFLLSYIAQFNAQASENGGGTEAPKKVLTSPKLTELQEAYKTAWGAMLQLTDPFAKETKDAKLAVWKIEGEIKTEEAAILKAENEAKIAEQRNQRLSLNQNQLDAHTTLIAIKADKKASAEAVAEAQTAFDNAKELVDNELLAKYAKSAPAKKSSEGDAPKTDKTAQTAEIVELYLAGKTNKEIEDLGFARSTVWHAINNYKKANA